MAKKLVSRSADQLAQGVKLDMADWWTTTGESYLGRVKKDQILAAIGEGTSETNFEDLRKMKKGELGRLLRLQGHGLARKAQVTQLDCEAESVMRATLASDDCKIAAGGRDPRSARRLKRLLGCTQNGFTWHVAEHTTHKAPKCRGPMAGSQLFSPAKFTNSSVLSNASRFRRISQ